MTMSECRSEFFINADGLRIAYSDWGGGGRTLICVHGLYRNRHDFDVLAGELANEFRILAVDMMGRGDSDPAPDVTRYNAEFYARDVVELADQLGLERFSFLGTSMGGMVGMRLAATHGQRLERLVLNDVGPEIRLAVLKAIGQRSVDAPASFAGFEEARAYFKLALRSWGDLGEDQVDHITRHSVREEGGRWVFRYDRKLIHGFRWPSGDVDLWEAYRRIPCPVLVIHGMQSEVLPEEVAARLRVTPGTTVLDVPDAGHAPALMAPEQIEAIRRFLR